jgi:probable rRNA maturation factor
LLTNYEIMAKSKKAKVCFFSYDIHPGLKNTKNLKQFLESIFKREQKKLESINYIFCTDKMILWVNKKYLDHDFYTDVITFDLSQNNKTVIAEVYVSIERVRDNARKLGVSIKSELHRVIFHAVLHLCEYNDKTKKDLERMRRIENKLLHNYLNN